MDNIATAGAASPLIVSRPEELLDLVGTYLGPTEWFQIDQGRVDMFAEATNDHQWIHVDFDRARGGPFGGTIAHGYLTLALVNHFLPFLIDVRGVAMGVNVGVDRLRFTSPVKVGASIRAVGEVASVKEAGGGIQATIRVTIEIRDETRPACVVETISRYYPENRA